MGKVSKPELAEAIMVGDIVTKVGDYACGDATRKEIVNKIIKNGFPLTIHFERRIPTHGHTSSCPPPTAVRPQVQHAGGRPRKKRRKSKNNKARDMKRLLQRKVTAGGASGCHRRNVE